MLGIGYSVSQTPTGRLIRKSANAQNRTALFAAQFALSHACWLITYPMVGFFSSHMGTVYAFIPMAILSLISLLFAMVVWKKEAELQVVHSHDDLPADHEQLREHEKGGNHSHA